MKTAYTITRATAAEKIILAAMFNDFKSDFEFEMGETLELASDGIKINRAFEGDAIDNDWQFIKCGCGRIKIICVENDHVFCFGCNNDLEVVNRRKLTNDKKATA